MTKHADVLYFQIFSSVNSCDSEHLTKKLNLCIYCLEPMIYPDVIYDGKLCRTRICIKMYFPTATFIRQLWVFITWWICFVFYIENSAHVLHWFDWCSKGGFSSPQLSQAVLEEENCCFILVKWTNSRHHKQ